MEQPPTLGTLLREYRLRTGMTQSELARRAGLSVRALRDIEQGRVAQPRSQSVQGLADALRLADIDHHRLLEAAGRAERGLAARRLHVGVLGPLVVRRGGALVEVGPARLRSLIGLLALQPGQLVARQEIVDVLWGEHPPSTCLTLVHTYVARLRRLLEPGRQRDTPSRILLRARGGYLLAMSPDQCDVLRFNELAEGARCAATAGDAEAVCDLSTQALALWRGPLLTDVDPSLRQHPAAVALCQRRLATALAYADSTIELGRQKEAVAPLQELVHDEPLHEALHARLMLALAGSGQQATALRLFADLRARLADELGVEPGAEVRDVHLRILRGQLPTGATPRSSVAGVAEQVAPAMLPAAVSAFTGRSREQAELDRLAQAGANTTTVVISALAGAPGVGKTALAVHWAHRVRDRFPDGQLYINLRGYARTPPLRPIEALAGFLHALGVAAERVPAELDQAGGLYRTLLADRRLLVLLDNARDAEQVRPLLPGSPGCLVLVTSRDRLDGLVARDGARRLALDVLTPEEAHTLLARLLGAARIHAEPQATAALAAACAYLPLALRIAAANLLSHRHHTVADYLAELDAGDRLAALQAGGDEEAAVRAAFDLSYAALNPQLSGLFRLLGLVSGPDLSVPAAAALIATTPERARQLLDRLAGTHLVNQHEPGRFTFHDLLRLYAAERGQIEDSQAERQAAIGRLLNWYLQTTDTAARLLYPQVVRLPVASIPAGPQLSWENDTQALAWLDAERPNLVATIQHAAVHGPRSTAWLLADALRGYFWLRMHTVDWLTVARAGLTAARADGDPRAEAAAQLNIADAHMRRSEHQRAIEHYRQALKLNRRIGWVDGQAATLGSLAGVYWRSGRLQEAADHLARALTLYRRTGQLAGQATALGNLGTVFLDRGPLALAVEHLGEALELFRKTRSRMGEAIYLGDLGEAYHSLGRLDVAVEYLTQALTLHRHTGDLGGEADTLRCLAAVHNDAGRHAQALELLDAALTIARKTGERRFEADALNTLASVHQRLGRHREAFEHYQQARSLGGETENLRSEAVALIGQATAHQCLGHPEQASACALRALALTRRAGLRLLEGDGLTVLAAIHLQREQPDRAAQVAMQALGLHRETGHRLAQARTLLVLGVALRATGRAEAALPCWQEAFALFAGIGSPEADQVRDLLEAHSGQHR
jgi:DNA-binding SARP family transcriptional activator/Tfp pilus assembly protein PilF